MCILSWLRCLLHLTGHDLGPIEYICDVIYCMFSACMQSQQEAELDYQRSGPTSTEMTSM
jgi:hypothetical protein